jgi:hypothetical protein
MCTNEFRPHPANVEPAARLRLDAIRDEVRELITEVVNRPGKIVVIAGAGVSADSGIRTYRGAPHPNLNEEIGAVGAIRASQNTWTPA